MSRLDEWNIRLDAFKYTSLLINSVTQYEKQLQKRFKTSI
jgi:hypothetical protein